ncbi:MAG: hypothetical protein QGG78_08845 [Acidimicrobiales bacterium]|nr:hypothetical protein [Acidimicrobiales bacterium]
MRTWLQALFAVALVAAGCGGGSNPGPTSTTSSTMTASTTTSTTTSTPPETSTTTSTSTSTSTSTTEPPTTSEPALPASWQGVTSTELHIGLILEDDDRLNEDFYTALAGAQNDRGGILGRQVVLHALRYRPKSAGSAESACTTLLEVEAVFMVLMDTVDEEAARCVSQRYGAPVVARSGLAADLDADLGGLLVTVEMDPDDARLLGLTALVRRGDLDDVRLGTVWTGATSRFRHGVEELVEEFTLDLVSETNLETTRADVDQLVTALRDDFAVEGVDIVLVLEDAGNHASALERVGSVVELVITDPEAVAPGFPGDVSLSTFVGGQVSALTIEVPRLEETQADPSVQECFFELAALDDTGSTSADIYLDVMHACQVFRLAMKLLWESGEAPTPEGFIGAVDSIGSFGLPGLAEASLGPDKHGAGDLLRRFAYDPDLGGLVAIGDPISATDLG